jgi:sRNA-binding regulator protein Hfq
MWRQVHPKDTAPWVSIPFEELIRMTKRTLPDSLVAEATAAVAGAVLEPPQILEAPPLRVAQPARKLRSTAPAPSVRHFPQTHSDEQASNRQAEMFYLQKQIQLQTQMVIILEDGARIQGVIEWYDRNSIKVRGKSRVLVYKSAIKYL